MRVFPDLHLWRFTRTRFNARFTREIPDDACARCHTPTINHARLPFTENKRYRTKARRIGDVVNRNTVSVYQTDAVLILIGGCKGRLKRALPTTKQ
jgi:hypothetical protein